jgi:hypothetical protein
LAVGSWQGRGSQGRVFSYRRQQIRWTVGLQLVRAADSVGANIAEASGRWHEADERWLLRARTRDLTLGRTDETLEELIRTMNGLVKKPTPR